MKGKFRNLQKKQKGKNTERVRKRIMVFLNTAAREFGVISTTPKRFLINRNLKVLLRFGVDCHPSLLRLSMSVSGHRWTWLEWTARKLS